MVIAPKHFPVFPEAAAHQQGKHHHRTEQNETESICNDGGADRQGLGSRGSGQLHPCGFIQHGLQEKGNHAHRQRRAVQRIALMHQGGVNQSGRGAEADQQTDAHRQRHTGQGEAHGFGMEVTQRQLGNQGGNAGGKQHGIDMAAQPLLFHGAVEPHAQNGGDNVEHIDAPGAKAHRQNNGLGRNMIGLCIQQDIERQTHETHQTHIQEGGCIAAHCKIVGGNLAGAGQDSIETGKHFGSVRHQGSCNQKCGDKKGEKKLQKVAFGSFI